MVTSIARGRGGGGVATCATDELGRWRDRAADGGPAGGWLPVATGNKLWVATGRRASYFSRLRVGPPSTSGERLLLHPVMGETSFNLRCAERHPPSRCAGRGPPSSGDGGSGWRAAAVVASSRLRWRWVGELAAVAAGGGVDRVCGACI
jgi:hypothetical protein